MENRIATTIDQSKKLLELGIDVNTADMVWIEDYLGYDSDGKRKHGKYRLYGDMLIPAYGQDSVHAWSLSALVDILPNDEVTITTVTKGGWDSEAAKYLNLWFAHYETEKHDDDFTLSADNPIDAAFEMVVKLKENNYL